LKVSYPHLVVGIYPADLSVNFNVKAELQMTDDQAALITFVIPHKGREEMLKQTLASIASQQFDLSSVRVVIVTQNAGLSSETLPDAPSLRVTVIQRPESDTISALRNAGVSSSTGEYLAFIDADIELAPNWIAAMLFELGAVPTRMLVSSVQKCSDDAPVLEKIRTTLSNAATDTKVRFLPGRNLLLRRETFHRVGGFPEHLITCEDYFFTDKVHELGDLYYSTASCYVHLGEDKQFDEMFRKEIWRGQSNLQSIKGRHIPLSEYPSYLVPLWVLLFAVVTVLSLITFNFSSALSALVLAMLPVLLYSLRLKKIAGNQIDLMDIGHFYLLYFPARIVGTLTGLFKAIRI